MVTSDGVCVTLGCARESLLHATLIKRAKPLNKVKAIHSLERLMVQRPEDDDSFVDEQWEEVDDDDQESDVDDDHDDDDSNSDD